MRVHSRIDRTRLLSAAGGVVAAGLFASLLAAPAGAAPAGYQSAVLADNPYLFYRLQETGTLTNLPAVDTSANHRADGIYRGTPTGGAAGAGPSSDTAVSFPGNTVTGLDYLRTTDTLGFGSLVAHSSYELIFKSNEVNPTNYQSIFGVFNQSDTTTSPPRTNAGAVAIEFNSNATGNTLAGTSRFYVRDEDGIALGGTFSNGTLLDGNYHHLAFTYDNTDANQQYIKAYVDGRSVPVSLVPQGGGSLTNIPDNFLDFTRDPVFGARNVRGVVGNEANVTLDEAALFTSALTQRQIVNHASYFLTAGDANADGKVGPDDFALIDRGYAQYLAGTIPANGALWPDGDFDRNGVVDSNDYFIIDSAWLAAHTPAPGFLDSRADQFGDAYVAALTASVPEPASGLTILGLGTLGLLPRRRQSDRA